MVGLYRELPAPAAGRSRPARGLARAQDRRAVLPAVLPSPRLGGSRLARVRPRQRHAPPPPLYAVLFPIRPGLGVAAPPRREDALEGPPGPIVRQARRHRHKWPPSATGGPRFEVGLVYSVRPGQDEAYRKLCAGAVTAFSCRRWSADLPLQDLKALCALRRLFLEQTPDIVRAFLKAGVLARLATALASVPRSSRRTATLLQADRLGSSPLSAVKAWSQDQRRAPSRRASGAGAAWLGQGGGNHQRRYLGEKPPPPSREACASAAAAG